MTIHIYIYTTSLASPTSTGRRHNVATRTPLKTQLLHAPCCMPANSAQTRSLRARAQICRDAHVASGKSSLRDGRSPSTHSNAAPREVAQKHARETSACRARGARETAAPCSSSGRPWSSSDFLSAWASQTSARWQRKRQSRQRRKRQELQGWQQRRTRRARRGEEGGAAASKEGCAPLWPR